MKDRLLSAKNFIITHKTIFIAVGGSVLGVAALTGIIVGLVIASQPKIVYQPVNACDLFTQAESNELIGDTAFNGNSTKPVITKDNAASTCSYSDLNEEDEDATIVAAVSVRSAINDKGMQSNIASFTVNRPDDNTQDVSGVGQIAYYNTPLGQLNVLTDDGKKWIILSYGVGSDPAGNKLDDVIRLARLVLN